jgi:cold-inducible RNA-binding protein
VKLFVGNLPFSVGDAELTQIFADHGEVQSARVISDRDTGRSRGFGFVEMPNSSEAETAISQLNGKDLGGRPLRINEARPREARR